MDIKAGDVCKLTTDLHIFLSDPPANPGDYFVAKVSPFLKTGHVTNITFNSTNITFNSEFRLRRKEPLESSRPADFCEKVAAPQALAGFKRAILVDLLTFDSVCEVQIIQARADEMVFEVSPIDTSGPVFLCTLNNLVFPVSDLNEFFANKDPQSNEPAICSCDPLHLLHVGGCTCGAMAAERKKGAFK